MNTSETHRPKADHRAYIETVRHELRLRDLHVGIATHKPGTVRSAAMAMMPPDDDFDEPWHHTFARAEYVELRWTEEEGWALLAMHLSDDKHLPTIWRPGFSPVPAPDEVCNWLVLLLAAPGFSTSREDGPYRTHQKPDPAFEAALAAYIR